MPSTYSHYRFGVQILPGLPADVRRPIQRYRRLFDIGLQGPDFFFYDLNPKNNGPELAHLFHYQTGREFFTRTCQLLHRESSEAALAYLYGLLAHFCLDSCCHPFVHEQTDNGPILHNELETEFDRFLLARDGKPLPHAYDRSIHLKFSKEDCGLIAKFYPPATAEQVHQGLFYSELYTRLLTARLGPHRAIAQQILKTLGGQKPGLLMHQAPNPACAHLNSEMLNLYNRALEQFPEYLEQLCSHLAYNAPLGEEFDAIFG